MTDLNNALNRKLDTSFALFDTDGDGFLQREDFQAQAQKALRALGEEATSAKGRTLSQDYGSLWTNIDTNGNGRVSLEEYRTLMTNPANQQKTIQIMTRISMRADLDEDGKLSREEYLKSPDFTGTSVEDRWTLFEQVDADGDGSVTSTEIAHALEAYFSAS